MMRQSPWPAERLPGRSRRTASKASHNNAAATAAVSDNEARPSAPTPVPYSTIRVEK
jgi:hypothetical protein